MLKYCHSFDEWDNSKGKLNEWLQDGEKATGQ